MANAPKTGGQENTETADQGKTPESLAGGAADAGKGKGTEGAAGKKDGETSTDTKKTGDGEQAGKKDGAPSGEQPAPKGKDGEAQPEPKAPEKYELKLPEGGRLAEDDLKSIEQIARAEGWTNEQAQARIDAHAEALEAQSAAFLAATEADPEYGGEKLAETQRLARAVLERVRPVGTPRGDALRNLLNRSGYGNNLEVIALLADLGKMMSEDGHVQAPSGGSKEKTAEQVLYGDE